MSFRLHLFPLALFNTTEVLVRVQYSRAVAAVLSVIRCNLTIRSKLTLSVTLGFRVV